MLLVYSAGEGDKRPLIFFNRGFRSTGHCHMIDLHEREDDLAKELYPGVLNGQQAGLFADLDGDGSQEMVLALVNGEVWIFRRGFVAEGQLTNEAGLCLSVALSSALHGPVAVTGWSGKRCLGAWNLTPGTAAFFGFRGAATCTLKWKLSDGKVQSKEITVESRPARFTVPAGGKQ